MEFQVVRDYNDGLAGKSTQLPASCARFRHGGIVRGTS